MRACLPPASPPWRTHRTPAPSHMKEIATVKAGESARTTCQPPTDDGNSHANLAAVGWVLRGYSEQYPGFQTVIVFLWASHTNGNYGLETRESSLRPRD